MRNSRIAVVGVGLMGRRHVDLVRAHPECALCAVVDPSPATAELALAAGVPYVPTLAGLLAGQRPDGVILATPNHLHVDQALACLNAGVPALLEKPMAPTLAEAARLCAAVEGTPGARILVGHHRRHSPIMARACEVIGAGTLGRIVTVQGSAQFYKPDSYFDEAPWRRLPGGGPILINLIHEIDNLRALCGEIATVEAFTTNAVRLFAVEDTAVVILRFESGALGTFLLSDTAASAKSWEQTTGENPAYARCENENCYEVAGTQGSLSIPTMRLRRYPSESGRSWRQPFEESIVAVRRDDPLVRQLNHFCAVVRGEVMPLVAVQDGLRNQRIVETIIAGGKHDIVRSTSTSTPSWPSPASASPSTRGPQG